MLTSDLGASPSGFPPPADVPTILSLISEQPDKLNVRMHKQRIDRKQ